MRCLWSKRLDKAGFQLKRLTQKQMKMSRCSCKKITQSPHLSFRAVVHGSKLIAYMRLRCRVCLNFSAESSLTRTLASTSIIETTLLNSIEKVRMPICQLQYVGRVYQVMFVGLSDCMLSLNTGASLTSTSTLNLGLLRFNLELAEI